MSWLDDVFRFVMGARKPDGNLDECQLDADRNLKVVIAGAASRAGWDDPPSFLSQRVIRNAPSTLLQFFGFSQTYGFLHLFDAASVPDDGARPAISIPLWGWGSPFALPLNTAGRDFTAGIAWAFSSTPDVLTKDSTAQVWANAQRT